MSEKLMQVIPRGWKRRGGGMKTIACVWHEKTTCCHHDHDHDDHIASRCVAGYREALHTPISDRRY